MREGWEYKKLGEIGEFQRGSGLSKKDIISDGYPCILYGQIHTCFGTSTKKHITCIPRELVKTAKIAHKGDVIMAITSEDVEGSCKSTAWLGDYDIAVGSDTAIYHHSQNAVYLSYYTQSKAFYNEKFKYARGFKVTHISTKDIENIPIPLPPLTVQQSIVSELDKLSELISLKKEQLKDYDNLAKSLFNEMFGDPVENEKGWEVKKLGEVCEISSSKRIVVADMVSEGIPFLRGTELMELSRLRLFEKGIYTLFITEEQYNHVKEVTGVPRKGDILIPSINSEGKTWIVDTELPFYFKDGRVIWVHQNEDVILSRYLDFVLQGLIRHVYSQLSGATFLELKLITVRTMQVPLPPLPLQQSFATKIEQIEKQKSVIEQQVEYLETLLASRMQYWFE